MTRHALEIDGHLVVISEVSGVTKLLLTPPQNEKRLVFFDVLTKSNATLRVSREADTMEVDDTINVVDGWRRELVDAVKEFLGEARPA